MDQFVQGNPKSRTAQRNCWKRRRARFCLCFRGIESHSGTSCGKQPEGDQSLIKTEIRKLNLNASLKNKPQKLASVFSCLHHNSNNDFILQDYGFDGLSNAISLTREYYQEFVCEFSLNYYPFDTQVCHMVFALQGFTKEVIVLRMDGEGAEYTGGKSKTYMKD